MDYNNITTKEEALMHCDYITELCERMTSGNYMHNVSAIKLTTVLLKKCIEKMEEQLWNQNFQQSI